METYGFTENFTRFNQSLQRQDNLPFIYGYDPMRTLPLQNIFNCWPAAAAPRLPERLFRAWPSRSLLEFLQLRSFDRSTSVSSSVSMSPRYSGEVARQHASARSNQRFVEPFSLLGTYSLPGASFTVHICGFNATVQLQPNQIRAREARAQ